MIRLSKAWFCVALFSLAAPWALRGDKKNVAGANENVTDGIVINELDADQTGTDSAEFVELFNTDSVNVVSLDQHALVFYNGANNGRAEYHTFDLSGHVIPAGGYFVIGAAGVANVDFTPIDAPDSFPATNAIQNGADAIALWRYAGPAADFQLLPADAPPSGAVLVDALVYDTDDEEAANLIADLGVSAQVNENVNGNGETVSVQRWPDGAGGALVWSSVVYGAPTPGVANSGAPANDYAVFPTAVDFGMLDAAGGPYLDNSVTISARATSVTIVEGAHSGDLDVISLIEPLGTVTVFPGAPQALTFRFIPPANNGASYTATFTFTSTAAPHDFAITVTGRDRGDSPGGRLPLYEGFEYSPGALGEQSAGAWATHSGSGDDPPILASSLNRPGLPTARGNRVELSSARAIDQHLSIGRPTGELYYSLIFRVTGDPADYGGSYFAHLKSPAMDYRARLYVETESAGSTFNLYLDNRAETGAQAEHPVPDEEKAMSLALNVTHFAVVRYNMDTGAAAFWANPPSATFGALVPPSPDDTDGLDNEAPAQAMTAIALRQGAGIGVIEVDEIRAGDSWAAVTVGYAREPTIVLVDPARDDTVTTLTAIEVNFSETVTGVAAGDLTVNGSAATQVIGESAGPYFFSGFATPSDGAIDVTVTSGGIAALSGAAFTGDAWSYMQDSGRVSVILNATNATHGGLANGAPTLFTAAFSEDVTGFDATDIIVDNGAVSAFAGAGGAYSFSVAPQTGAGGEIKVFIPANATAAVQPPHRTNVASNRFRFLYLANSTQTRHNFKLWK